MTSLSYKEVQPLLGAEETSNRKEEILNLLSERLAHNPFILSARGYGSFFTGEGSVDLDLAVMVPSRHSVIEEETYLALRETRASLCRELKIDVDLVPIQLMRLLISIHLFIIRGIIPHYFLEEILRTLSLCQKELILLKMWPLMFFWIIGQLLGGKF